jgi:hypothetical protein
MAGAGMVVAATGDGGHPSVVVGETAVSKNCQREMRGLYVKCSALL